MNEFSKQGSRLICRRDDETIWIEPWGKDSLRVRCSVNKEIVEEAHALLKPGVLTAEIDIEGETAVIRNGSLEGRILADDRLAFFRTDTGEELLAQPAGHRQIGPRPRRYQQLQRDLHWIEVKFKAYDDEHCYGLGQHQHGLLDQKGSVIDLHQYNTEVTIPVLISSRMYGFLWNNPAMGQVELGYSGTRWVAQASRQIDFVIFTGNNYGELMGRYAEATGHAPVLPSWASGFWQSKCRYLSQDELLAVARRHKELSLPLSVIVADYYHWPAMGEWQFDSKCWPDPEGMVRELEEMGVKLMVSIWPSVNPACEDFQRMQSQGLLADVIEGSQAVLHFPDTYSDGRVDLYLMDPSNPRTREYWWKKIRENYYSKGVRLWWLDAIEPETILKERADMKYLAGTGAEVGCRYPMWCQQTFYDGMKSAGEEEIVTLCRSGWAGSQRYGAAIWSGDVYSTWEAFRKQVPAGLNIGLSGIPWWTTDIGGFIGGQTDSPEFHELLIRWFQYGTFCPLFRLHGSRVPKVGPKSADNEVWSFGPEAFEILKKFMFIRERMRPYIMEQMKAAHPTGTPPMRPLFFDFSEDAKAFEVADAFMFGPDLLVAPILYEGAREREVYLPAGTEWINAWTDRRFAGGQTVTAEAPLEIIPLFVRDGADLPIRE